MTKTDQKRIINEMCTNLRSSLLAKLPRIPESWDGLELRELLADTAREDFAIRRPDKRKLKSYNNDRRVYNL